MQKGTAKLSEKLLSRIFTTKTLKAVIDSLESLTQNKIFKSHATSIITDPTLTPSQKKTQLLYVLRAIDLPILYDFFQDELTEEAFWVLNSGKVDYFDRFVQAFQEVIETVTIVNFATSIELNHAETEHIAKFFTDILGKKTILNHEVNPSILGGAVVKLENMIFDFSLRHKFRVFSTRWLNSLEKTSDRVGYGLPA